MTDTDINDHNSDNNENDTTKIENIPLCVDMDGSIIYTDLLFESVLVLLKQSFWLVFFLPFWLWRGKGYLKYQIAKRTDINSERLPYHREILDYLEEEKNKGRKLILVTGSHEKYAQQIADHLGIFDSVIATTKYENCTSHNKARRLKEEYGMKGFDYAGNSHVDVPIWQIARKAIVANASTSTLESAKAVTEVEKVFPGLGKPNAKNYLKALRIHQWMKNLLIFVPLLTAHKVNEPALIIDAVLAFVFMSACASATYIVNDLLDLQADRGHHSKYKRPFASGVIPIWQGVMISILLLTACLTSFFVLSPDFFAVLGCYLILTLSYSFRFKRLQSVDIMTLAMLYTIRVLAGAAAIGVNVSFWLLAFSLFIFISLGIVKRVSELQKLASKNLKRAEGRGYEVSDLPTLQGLGTAAGYLSVLIIALYVNSSEVKSLYSSPETLWLLCPVLGVWVTRIWILCGRGLVDEDPVEFAIKDKYSWITGGICALILAAATLT